MKVLVTGGTGFVGSHTIAKLVADGHTVRAFVRNEERLGRALEPHGVKPDSVALGDITELEAVEAALEGQEAVVHTAAMIGLKRSQANETFNTNVIGVRNVVGTALRLGLDPVIYTSSISALFPPPGPVMTLDDPITPPSTGYQASKSVAEHIIRTLEVAGQPVVSIFPGGITGPTEPALGDFHTSLVDQIGRRAFISPDTGFTLIDVRDLAAVIAASLEPGRGPRRFMLGGHWVPMPDLIAEISRLLGISLRPLRIPNGAVRGMGRVGDVVKRFYDFEFPMTYEAMDTFTRATPSDDSATWEATGLAPRPWTETILDTLKWLRDAGHLSAEDTPGLEIS